MIEPKRLKSASEYEAHIAETEIPRLFKERICDMLLAAQDERLTLPGFSIPAGCMVDFLIDPDLRTANGSFNLRETVNCPETAFNQRMRASIHAIALHEKEQGSDVYIMEQKTHLFSFFQGRYPGIIGSEFLGKSIPLGECDEGGLRNEDATRLTFDNASFDFIMSFEVLEHIPDYLAAFNEVQRILRPGGRFYFTAPFNADIHHHLIRAKMEGDEIHHIIEPEWHGNPVTGKDILCFQHFGWAILDELKACGFNSIEAIAFDQIEYGYFSQDPILVFRAVTCH